MKSIRCRWMSQPGRSDTRCIEPATTKDPIHGEDLCQQHLDLWQFYQDRSEKTDLIGTEERYRRRSEN